MPIEIDQLRLIERLPTSQEFNGLLDAVGWRDYFNFEASSKALQNSLYGVVVKDNGAVIGMGRIVGDRAINFYIQDVVVAPDYQGKSIGTMIVTKMMDYVQQHAPNNAYIGLFSVETAKDLYKKFGFKGPEEYLYGMCMRLQRPPGNDL
jgi:ribosomal protein S18 acetylase RimI-like enzyme